MTEAVTTTMQQPPTLTALEAMPADLRLMLGWRRLFALVLDSVMAAAPEAVRATGRTPILLTLTTYCYASNLLVSDDIESACRSDGDVAYIADGEVVSAAELRRFRRGHRMLIEGCLQRVFTLALKEFPANSPVDCEGAETITATIGEFTRRRFNLAVLFDMALSD